MIFFLTVSFYNTIECSCTRFPMTAAFHSAIMTNSGSRLDLKNTSTLNNLYSVQPVMAAITTAAHPPINKVIKLPLPPDNPPSADDAISARKYAEEAALRFGENKLV